MLPTMFALSHLQAKGIRMLPLLHDPHDLLFYMSGNNSYYLPQIYSIPNKPTHTQRFCGPNCKDRKAWWEDYA